MIEHEQEQTKKISVIKEPSKKVWRWLCEACDWLCDNAPIVVWIGAGILALLSVFVICALFVATILFGADLYVWVLGLFGFGEDWDRGDWAAAGSASVLFGAIVLALILEGINGR